MLLLIRAILGLTSPVSLWGVPGLVGPVGGGGGLLFENCTVDASIL